MSGGFLLRCDAGLRLLYPASRAAVRAILLPAGSASLFAVPRVAPSTHSLACLGSISLQENEPYIFDAIKFGTILENVVFDEETRHVDYDVSAITENTRASYPIEHIGE